MYTIERVPVTREKGGDELTDDIVDGRTRESTGKSKTWWVRRQLSLGYLDPGRQVRLVVRSAARVQAGGVLYV